MQMVNVEVEGDKGKGPADGGSSSQPRKPMRRLSQQQYDLLEAAFEQNHFPDKKTKEDLAEKLKIPTRTVHVWFQNRRSRLKELLIQTEKQRDDYKQRVNSLTQKVNSLTQKVNSLTEEKCCLESELAKLEETRSAPPPPPPPPPASPVLFPVLGPIPAYVQLCHDCGRACRAMSAEPPPPAAPMLPPSSEPAQASIGLCPDCRRTYRTMSAAAASLAPPQGGASATPSATTGAPPPPPFVGGSMV